MRIVIFLYPQRIGDMQVIITVVKLEHQHILWMGIAYRERKLAYADTFII
jgi:hypothetical protein